MTESHELSSHPVEAVVKPTISERIATSEQTQLTDRLPGTDNRKDRIRHNKETIRYVQM